MHFRKVHKVTVFCNGKPAEPAKGITYCLQKCIVAITVLGQKSLLSWRTLDSKSNEGFGYFSDIESKVRFVFAYLDLWQIERSWDPTWLVGWW